MVAFFFFAVLVKRIIDDDNKKQNFSNKSSFNFEIEIGYIWIDKKKERKDQSEFSCIRFCHPGREKEQLVKKTHTNTAHSCLQKNRTHCITITITRV